MSNVEVRRNRVRLACLALVAAAVALIAPAAAQAEDTVWICKPGQADDLCAGTIDGVSNPAPGQAAEPLPYKRPADAPADCFYLYPTQSEQHDPQRQPRQGPAGSGVSSSSRRGCSRPSATSTRRCTGR